MMNEKIPINSIFDILTGEFAFGMGEIDEDIFKGHNPNKIDIY